MLFVFLWVIKNLITTSCFFYPVKISCFNFSWKTSDVVDMVVTIQNWNSLIFNSFVEVLLNYKNFLLLFLIIFLFIIIYLERILNFVVNNKKYFLLLTGISLILLPFSLQPLDLITHKIQTQQSYTLQNVYFKEIIFMFLFYILSIFSIIIPSKKQIILNKLNNLRFKQIIPFIFFVVVFYIWVISTPNPRLGQNLFLVIIPVFFILLINLDKFSCFDYNKYFKFFLFLVIFNISIVENYEKINFKSILFLKQSVPDTKLIKRKSYGFAPANGENFCWIKEYCHPYSDVKIYRKYLNYKFFKEIVN